ncbi:uncharacterized protein LOC128278266 [Anopheles cruzii]|uniref:uncharacterized protein LOC128278266 n=1 Tax=Anopheles cruzii TaxID=68878 RepID=UPI0022EC4264|nr:uncharacterized protein LOC128278266 [Anopheles cruzii]
MATNQDSNTFFGTWEVRCGEREESSSISAPLPSCRTIPANSAVPSDRLLPFQIVESFLDGTTEALGLNGVKFRLDEMGDIIWYNDLVSTTSNRGTGHRHQAPAAVGGQAHCPVSNSTAVLFSCETFEVVQLASNGPCLIFGAYTGHSIEFRTNSYNPRERMSLRCDGWCQLHCRRVQNDQSVGQEEPFTLLSVLDDGNFCDVTLTSSDNVTCHVHSPILRLNGFDCSSAMTAITGVSTGGTSPCSQRPYTTPAPHGCPMSTGCSWLSAARCSTPRVIVPADGSLPGPGLWTGQSSTTDTTVADSPFTLNPNFLLPPDAVLDSVNGGLAKQVSNSFHCLTDSAATRAEGTLALEGLFSLDRPKRAASCSDSHLNAHRQSVFYFPDVRTAPAATLRSGITKFKTTPGSPFKPAPHSQSPFPAALDTPPSSPLTPLSVLQNIPADLLSTVLHWLYCECLPDRLDEDACRQLIDLCDRTAPLARMGEPCRNYLRNIQLKQFVIDIINDLHDSLNHLVQLMHPGSISRSPCVLCQVFKEGVKETLTAIVKLLQFCNIFTKDATSFTRYQRHEIIKYVRTRMPVYLSQVHQLLQNVNLVLGSLTPDDRNDLVSYLVPEITAALELVTAAVTEVKLSLEKVCKDLKGTHQQQQQQQQTNTTTPCGASHQQQQQLEYATQPGRLTPGRVSPARGSAERLGTRMRVHCTTAAAAATATATTDSTGQSADLRFFLYMYEVKKMRDIYGRVTSALEMLLRKKSTFNEMHLLHQHQTVRHNLEQLVVEVPAAIGQLEELCDTIDEKIGWKEFKFCFKFLTSQVNGIVSKLLEHKAALNDAMLYISTLVQKKQFTYALMELGLLDKCSVDPGQVQECTQKRSAVRSSAQRRFEYSSVKVNLVKSLCEPPTAAHSILAKNALKLLHSGQLTDMEFEVVVPKADHEIENVVATGSCDYGPDGPNGPVPMVRATNTALKVGTSKGSQSHCFKAHRVIVAARCEWFKKALLSGMQEDINRKIVIYDTSVVIFRRLLLYLYGAPVDKSVSVEQLCELMLLADRYSVDNLKAICEETLVASIDAESVIYLYGISDRFNASALQASCLSYLSQHTELTQLDIFQQLPANLQNEVQDLIRWCGRVPEPWYDCAERSRSDPRSRHSLRSPSKTSRSSHSRKHSPSFM